RTSSARSVTVAAKLNVAACVALALSFGALSPVASQQSAAPPKPDAPQTAAQSQGHEIFNANCSDCHQHDGKGLPGAFPPLAGHVEESFSHPAGLDYLPRVVLFGLEGKIAVKGDLFDGTMPSWQQLNDTQIAAVLNYILNAWGNDKLLPPGFTPIK